MDYIFEVTMDKNLKEKENGNLRQWPKYKTHVEFWLWREIIKIEMVLYRVISENGLRGNVGEMFTPLSYRTSFST